MEKYNNELGEIIQLGPREGTEAHRVLQEVEKKKAVAKEKRIDKLMIDLYFKYLQYGTSYPKLNPSVNQILSKAEKRSCAESPPNRSNDKLEIIDIVLNENEYSLYFTEECYSLGGDYTTYGSLELFAEKNLVLSIKMSEDYSYGVEEWSSFGFDAFCEGRWIEDFEALKKAIVKDKREAKLRDAEDLAKTEELKARFGIE